MLNALFVCLVGVGVVGRKKGGGGKGKGRGRGKGRGVEERGLLFAS